MAVRARAGGFLLGLASGAVIGFALLLMPVLWLGAGDAVALYTRVAPLLQGVWELVSVNLQGSVLPFTAIGLFYWILLRRLSAQLDATAPAVDRVLRHEQLLDLCSNLFFGVGVIWTAIGMRHALLHALGDPAASAEAGAFAILQRLVDGGILLALSTTIVGGIGGYLMRAIKSLLLGGAINSLYMHAAEQPGRDSLAALRRIERGLRVEPAARDRP